MKNLEKQLPEVAVPIEDGKKYILKLPEDTDPYAMEYIGKCMHERFPTVILMLATDFELYKIED